MKHIVLLFILASSLAIGKEAKKCPEYVELYLDGKFFSIAPSDHLELEEDKKLCKKLDNEYKCLYAVNYSGNRVTARCGPFLKPDGTQL